MEEDCLSCQRSGGLGGGTAPGRLLGDLEKDNLKKKKDLFGKLSHKKTTKALKGILHIFKAGVLLASIEVIGGKDLLVASICRLKTSCSQNIAISHIESRSHFKIEFLGQVESHFIRY